MSILEHLKKINVLLLGAMCLVLGAGLAFGSHKLSAFEGQKQGIRVDSSEVARFAQEIGTETGTGIYAQPKQKTTQEGGRVVASKSGKKYHLLSCPGAKTITEKNRIYFETPSAAEKVGYTPALNCKGLKL